VGGEVVRREGVCMKTYHSFYNAKNDFLFLSISLLKRFSI